MTPIQQQNIQTISTTALSENQTTPRQNRTPCILHTSYRSELPQDD